MIRKHFHDLSFDGKLLSDFGVHISGEGTFNAPEKQYETVEVPGRSGDLHISKGKFANITVKYPAFIFDDFDNNLSLLKNYMLSKDGYKRLEDTYHSEEYRMAMYKGPLSPTVTLLQAGTFDLEFQCKPQRFLKNGEQPVTFTTSGSSVFNLTSFESFPMIRIYGTGSVGLGDNTITIRSGHGQSYIDIDCELMDAFHDATNCNPYVTFYTPTGNNRITLKPGSNGVSFENGISKVMIWPRWWIL